MCTIVLIGCCLASFFLKVPKIEGGKEQLAKMKGFKLNDVFELKALPISIISALMGFSFSAILSFLTSYTREINLVYEGSFSLSFMHFSL